MIIITNKYVDKFLSFCGAIGQSHLGFIILLKSGQTEQTKKRIINHEQIHNLQARELLIVFWYAFYILNYVINWGFYFNHDEAYRNIIFEREAYANDQDFTYLKNRHLFSFLKY